MISDIDDKFFSYNDQERDNFKYIQDDNTEDDNPNPLMIILDFLF